MAGSIQFLQRVMKNVVIFMFVFHAIQSSVRMYREHDMVFTTWYPFHVSNTPVYEIINVTQVIFLPLHISAQLRGDACG